jgi:hypothetical protein
MSRGTIIKRGNGYSIVLDLGRGPGRMSGPEVA